MIPRLLDFVRDQSAFKGRVAGSEAERNCQAALAGRLDRLGMEAVVEGAVCPPLSQHILFVHGLAFLIGVALTLVRPMPGAILGGLTMLSFWGELRGRPRILRDLLLRRLSGNMIARLRQNHARAKLVLVAHADVASSSLHFHPWVKRFTVRRERPGRTIHPGALVLMAGGAQTLAALELASRPDISYLAMTAMLAAAMVHLGLVVLAVDWWRSPPVEGAVDNASGLAVVWGVAEALAAEPMKNTELWVLATGDREPDCGGMRAFLHQSAYMFDRGSTFFVNVDDVGRGRLHYATAEGRWHRIAYRPTLPALAERLAQRDRQKAIPETTLVGMTDAGMATRRGFRAITVTSLEEGQRPALLHTHEDCFEQVEPASLGEAYDFVLHLAREIDDFVGGDAG
ncbi:MAG: M28 family peptidase [Myxococcota bacterium]|nr:M28 family peptidase [Myxococcota bacterium]